MRSYNILTIYCLLSNNIGQIIAPEFPLVEFYGDFSPYKILIDGLLCNKINRQHKQGDSSNGVNSTLDHRQGGKMCCDCDENCWQYATCCIDKLWNVTGEENLDEYLRMFKRTLMGKQKNKKPSCETILPIDNRHKIETLYMVSTCPLTANNNVKKFCNNMLSDLPVLGNDSYLYRNKHCAKCNGIENITQLQMDVKCVYMQGIKNETVISLGQLYNFQECLVSIKRTRENIMYLKKCQKQEISENCSERDLELCYIHQGKVAKHFNNYFCLKCSKKMYNNASNPGDNRILQCLSECGESECILPEGRDLSKYSYRVELTPLPNSKFQVKGFHQTFPIWKFFGIKDLHLKPDEGFEQYLCSGRRKKCCHCHKDCMINKTCCIDYLWNQSSPVDVHSYKTLLTKNAGDTIEDCICLPTSINMIKSCRRNPIQFNHRYCTDGRDIESLSTTIPLLGNDGGNSLLRECNFAKNTNATIKCRNEKDITFPLVNKNGIFTQNFSSDCKLTTIEASQYCEFTQRFSKFTLYCNLGDSNYHLCKAYAGQFDSYPNFHCRLCNSRSEIDSSMIHYCDFGSTRQPFRWSLTLSFTDDTTGFATKCPSGQYFKTKESKCVAMHCPLNHIISGFKCVLDIDELVDSKYFVYILKPNTTNNIDHTSNVTMNLPVFKSIRNFTIQKSPQPVNITDLTSILGIFYSYSEAYPGSQFYIGINIHPSHITLEYGLDFSRFFYDNRLCAKPVILLPNETKAINSTTVAYKSQTFPTKDVAYWISFENNQIVEHHSICRQFHLTRNCVRELIPHYEVTIEQNMTIKHIKSNVIYNAEDYFPSNENYFVCLRKNSDSETKLFEVIEKYVNKFAIPISIVCYASIILTYILFQDLCTIPGLSTCCLCASLLISDVMALLSTNMKDNSLICFVTAAVTHWSSLATFSWTLVISFDLVSRFASFSLPSNDRKVKKMIYRSVFGYIIPAIVVLVSAILDANNIIEVGYGKYSICYRVNNANARIVLYILPTGLATFIALTSLCYTICKISKDMRSSEKYIERKQNSKANFLKMAIKLCVILGITEIPGYIQVPNPDGNEILINDAFGFVYAIFRSTRGIMLWFVYIYGDRMINRYKELTKKIFCMHNSVDSNRTIPSEMQMKKL